jgi:hypothetical protein
MPTFRKRPVEIEAHYWDGSAQSASNIIDWILSHGGTANYICADANHCIEHEGDSPHTIAIQTLEGVITASARDWVIKGVAGEFYPCKPEIFAATYEKAVDDGW